MAEPTIRPQSVATLERVGLARVIDALADLFDSPDGQQKHGDRGWEEKSETELAAKLLGHLSQHMAGSFFDDDSGRMTVLHATARALQLAEKFVRPLKVTRLASPPPYRVSWTSPSGNQWQFRTRQGWLQLRPPWADGHENRRWIAWQFFEYLDGEEALALQAAKKWRALVFGEVDRG